VIFSGFYTAHTNSFDLLRNVLPKLGWASVFVDALRVSVILVKANNCFRRAPFTPAELAPFSRSKLVFFWCSCWKTDPAWFLSIVCFSDTFFLDDSTRWQNCSSPPSGKLISNIVVEDVVDGGVSGSSSVTRGSPPTLRRNQERSILQKVCQSIIPPWLTCVSSQHVNLILFIGPAWALSWSRILLSCSMVTEIELCMSSPERVILSRFPPPRRWVLNSSWSYMPMPSGSIVFVLDLIHIFFTNTGERV